MAQWFKDLVLSLQGFWVAAVVQVQSLVWAFLHATSATKNKTLLKVVGFDVKVWKAHSRSVVFKEWPFNQQH